MKHSLLAFLIFFLCSAALTQASESAAEPVLCTDGNHPTSLNWRGYIEAGGIDQWVTIRGKNCDNPVLLFVHGGPGNPSSVFSEDMYQGWETDFTIVHWDQRTSGKTFQKNNASMELTMEVLKATELSLPQIAADGHSIVSALRLMINSDKVVLVGSSWGAAVAMHMVGQNSEPFRFLMAISPLINYEKSLDQGFQKMLVHAEQTRQPSIKEGLKRLGSPPWANPRSFGQFRRLIRQFEAPFTDEFLISDYYLDNATRQAYSAGEELSFAKFIGFGEKGMSEGIRLDETHIHFDVPVVLFQGEQDFLIPQRVTEEYFSKLQAPNKALIISQDSAHQPNRKALRLLKQVIKTKLDI